MELTTAYPIRFGDIAEWAARNAVTRDEARVRFAQYAILHAIAGSRVLRTALVFKGGNALDFMLQPNRSTRDLDFTADALRLDTPLDVERLRHLLTDAVAASGRVLGVTFRVYRVAQQPPGASRTFFSYEARIGYALQGEDALRRRMEAGQPSSQVIPIDISTNEPICADEEIPIDGARRLRVSTIEDIVAEKLRALLQQKIRNRSRRQDLLDIAVIVRARPELDRDRIALFLIEKASARNVPVSHTAFHDPEIARRAREDYSVLQTTTRVVFIPFDEALEVLLTFVDGLPLPEN